MKSSLALITLATSVLGQVKPVRLPDRIYTHTLTGGLSHNRVENGIIYEIQAELTIPEITLTVGKDHTYDATVFLRFGGFGYNGVCDLNKEPAIFEIGFHIIYTPGGRNGVYAYHRWTPEEKIYISDPKSPNSDFTYARGNKYTLFIHLAENKKSIEARIMEGDGGPQFRSKYLPIDHSNLDDRYRICNQAVFWGVDAVNGTYYPNFHDITFNHLQITANDGKSPYALRPIEHTQVFAAPFPPSIMPMADIYFEPDLNEGIISWRREGPIP